MNETVMTRAPRLLDGVRYCVAGAALLLLAGACHEDSPAESPSPEISVDVQPSAPQLAPHAALDFDATVTGTTNTTVVWSVREGIVGGTVDAGGLYTAPGTTGVYHVVATSVANPAAFGAAMVTVTTTPVIAVWISPRNPSVRIGGSLTFTAQVSGTSGEQSTAVTWSVLEPAGGTISSSGVYTPPADAGTYHVVATSVADPGKMDTTSVRVSQAAGAVPAAAPVVASTRFTPAISLTSPSMAISGLGQAVFWWDRTQDVGGWDTRTGLGYTCINRPVDYVIEASSDGGATWTSVASVAGNTYYTRAHIVDLTGYTSVRMRITVAANIGSQYMFVEIQLHDASNGSDDWWVFFGDSVTDNVFAGPSGQTGLGTGRFGYNVNQLRTDRWPIAYNGGVSQGTMSNFLQLLDGHPLFHWWMVDYPGRFVSLVIGTNDINGFSDHAITSAELDVMQGKMEQLVEIAQAAGKTVILPTLRWTNTHPYTGPNIAVWNDRLWNVVLPKYPDAIRGPDTYTRSAVQGISGLRSDNTHLNDAGATLTQEDWTNWATAEFYR